MDAENPTVQLKGKVLLLAGPTAAGKTDVALLLAEKLGGEIISVDSMQVYRGMDIGTAKASPEERGRIPHHLVDVVEVDQPFDAAQFVNLARSAVQEIQSREHLPIFCGGTGLYFKAFLEGLGKGPASDPALRAELIKTPLPQLLKELESVDPALRAKIDQKNARRVIRAVEVIRMTGKPFSEQRADWTRPDGHGREQSTARWFGVARSNEDLHARISMRVERMFQRGLVAETEGLLKRGLSQNETAMQALGYRQVVEYLRGERSLPETIERVKSRTRQYAKRQMTWFRRERNIQWLMLLPEQAPDDIAAQIIKYWRFK